MALWTYTFKNDPNRLTGRPPRYYIADTLAELPTSGLMIGDLASVNSDGKAYRAISSTTWLGLATDTELANAGGGTTNIDGGTPLSVYDGTSPVDGGTV